MNAHAHFLIAKSLQYKRNQFKKLPYKKLLVAKRRNAAILKNRRIATKKRPRHEDDVVRRKVWTLKSLIPNSDSDSKGLEGLFRDTADYIMDLETRIKLMQMMVDALSGSTDCLE